MILTHKEKWQAFITRDSNYDGIFYTAVKTTGIFCKPSCRARKPLEKNVIFYDTLSEAKANGFRPCKICEPEGNTVEDIQETACDLYEDIKAGFTKPIDFKAYAAQNNVSLSHLVRVFKSLYLKTPRVFLIETRIECAQRLLVDTDDEIMKIAYDVGFTSLSSFYKHFKTITGKSPNDYRVSYESESFNE